MRKIKLFFNRIKLVLKNKYFLLCAAVIVIAGGALIYVALTKPAEMPNIQIPVKKPAPVDTRVQSKLEGIKVDPSVNNRKILAVVVENHPDARPQSGLDKASIIYETLAEGGITRFLALYQENQAEEIGPVRSARLCFLDWTLEYDALFAHVGGNVLALNKIGPLGIQDINQFYYANYFWRDNSRYAPHNVYTSTEKLRAAGAQKKYPTTSDFKGLDFKADASPDQRPASAQLTVHFSGYEFDPTYTYDRNNNVWLRSEAGVPFKDKVTGKQIAPKNVIVQYEGYSNITDIYDHTLSNFQTLGSGKAEFYMDGKQIVGTWEKADRKSQTVYKDSVGNPIKLDTGQTWIEVVPSGNTVDFR